MHLARPLVIVAGAWLLAGCGGHGPELASVRGSVSFRDAPLKRGTIIFQVPGQRPATGKIVDGKITDVTTFEVGDGAPLGAARIAIFATADSDWQPPPPAATSPGQWSAAPSPPMVTPSLIPERYNDPSTSGLQCEVRRGKNALELSLAE